MFVNESSVTYKQYALPCNASNACNAKCSAHVEFCKCQSKRETPEKGYEG